MAPRYTNRSNSYEDENPRRQHRASQGADADSSYRQGRSVGRAQDRSTRSARSTSGSHARTGSGSASSARGTSGRATSRTHDTRDARSGAQTRGGGYANSYTSGHSAQSSRGTSSSRGASASHGRGVNTQFDPTSERYERNAARSAHAATAAKEHRFFSPYHILIACVIVIIAIIVVAVMINGPRENAPQEDPTPNYIENVSYTPHSTDLDRVPSATDGIATFSLIEGEGANKVIPTLTEEQTRAITYTLDQIKAITPDVGFLILDIDTGAGICYNIDQDIYAASSFKGPYSVYVCESATSGSLPSSTRDNIHNAISWSDNNSYYRLRNAYNGTTFTSWMEDVGVDPAKAARTFPTYNTRDLAKLWLHSYPYLTNTNDTKAQWLANEFRNTEVSFLRDGIVLSGASDATVMNKGGWIIGSKNYNSVIDAGLIEDDGHHYLVSIMTALPDGEPREQLVSDLAATLYSIRGILDQNLEDDAAIAPYDAQKSKASAEAVSAAKSTTSTLKSFIIDRLKQTLPTYTTEEPQPEENQAENQAENPDTGNASPDTQDTQDNQTPSQDNQNNTNEES